MTCIGELTCIPSHGNAEDSGLCLKCEDMAIASREAHIAKLRAALTAFADQMPGQMWDYAVTHTVSALVRSLSMDGKCRLCGHHGNDHRDGCAVEGLREVME